MMQNSFIKVSYNSFTSVSSPYSEDTFTKANSVPININDFDKYDYYKFLKNGLLEKLIVFVSSLNPCGSVSFIDAGVYMGTFSIGSSLICQENNINYEIYAIEAMELLIPSIQQNLNLYNADNVQLLNYALDSSNDEVVEFGLAKGGFIAGTAVNPREKAGIDGEVYKVTTISMEAIISKLKTKYSIVKLDIEGNEVNAFKSLFISGKNFENVVFIIEFAPWQAKVQFPNYENYGEFLLKNFKVLNIRNWGRKLFESGPSQIKSLEDFFNCLNEKRSSNTDLLLIPKHIKFYNI